MDDLVRDFLVESYEGLDQLDRDVVLLETMPHDSELLARIFRCIHTIKGTCGFFGFTRLEAVTHAGEGLLARLRDGQLRLAPESIAALLSLVDVVRSILAGIEAEGREGNDVDAAQAALLQSLQALAVAPSVHDAGPGPAAPSAPSNGAPPALSGAIGAGHAAPGDSSGGSDDVPKLGELLVQSGAARPQQVADAIRDQLTGHPYRVGELLVARGVVTEAQLKAALDAQQDVRTSALVDRMVRVDVALLDRLMTLAEDLVQVRDEILHDAVTGCSGGVAASATRRLTRLTSELQDVVMTTRRQPIDSVWSKLPRLVRDLAQSCGKQVRVELTGRDTELDRAVLDAIKDPVMHIVRNALDHGIEAPEVRRQRGKPVEGRLELRAYQDGDEIAIEVADDGAGLDVERLRSTAVARGFLGAGESTRLADHDLRQLVFLPGFTTAQRVTNVSGRGIGMDVVRTNVARIGGSVVVDSRAGEGMTVRIRIPVASALLPAAVTVGSAAG